MATILIGMLPHVSHLNASFQLARDLQVRGHRVVYASPDEDVKDTILAQGFAFHRFRWPSIADGGDVRPAHPPVRRSVAGRRVRAALNAVRASRAARRALMEGAVIDETRDAIGPDLVILDCTMTALAIAFSGPGRPVVLLNTFLPLDQDDNVPPSNSSLVPRPCGKGRWRIRLAWERYLARRRLEHLTRSAFSIDEPGFLARLAARHGFPVAGRLDNRRYFTPGVGLPEIVLCPQAFDFPRRKRPHVIYSEPGVHLERHEPAFEWPARDRHSHAVFCSIGTLSHTFAGGVDFLKRVVDGFRDRPDHFLLVAMGSQVDPPSVFGDLPANVRVEAYVPQVAALHWADVFITHGGLNSLKEAVLTGTPVAVFPFANDAFGNAARVAYHAIGKRGSAHHATPTDITRMVDELLADTTYAKNVDRMRLCFVEARTRSPAADIVETFLPRG